MDQGAGELQGWGFRGPISGTGQFLRVSQNHSQPQCPGSAMVRELSEMPRVQDGAPVCSIVHSCRSAQPVQSVWLTGATELQHLAWQGPGAQSIQASLHLSFLPFPDRQGDPLFSPLPVRTSQRECPILKADLQIITNKNNTSLVSVPKGLGRMIEIPKALNKKGKRGGLPVSPHA